MLFDLLIQFAVEMFRALFIDALSERVQRNIAGAVSKRRVQRRQRFYRGLKSRPARRLLHKLRTDRDRAVQ